MHSKQMWGLFHRSSLSLTAITCLHAVSCYDDNMVGSAALEKHQFTPTQSRVHCSAASLWLANSGACEAEPSTPTPHGNGPRWSTVAPHLGPQKQLQSERPPVFTQGDPLRETSFDAHSVVSMHLLGGITNLFSILHERRRHPEHPAAMIKICQFNKGLLDSQQEVITKYWYGVH